MSFAYNVVETIKQRSWPTRVKPHVLEVVGQKARELEKVREQEREALEQDLRQHDVVPLTRLSPEDHNIIARYQESLREFTAAQKAFQARFFSVTEKDVKLSQSAERHRELQQERDARYEVISDKYRGLAEQLILVAEEMHQANVQAVRAKVPAPLLDKLDAIGKEA